MSDQIRKEKEIVGKLDDSAFKLSRETEQRLIREFRSPLQEERAQQAPVPQLLANACWNYTTLR